MLEDFDNLVHSAVRLLGFRVGKVVTKHQDRIFCEVSF